MDWDKKVEMLELAQNSENLVEFHRFVRLNIDYFDTQAWSILINVVELNRQYVESNKDFLIIILEKIAMINGSKEGIGLSMRELVRLCILQELIDELN